MLIVLSLQPPWGSVNSSPAQHTPGPNNGKHNLSLLFQSLTSSSLVSQMQCDSFLLALKQVRHGPFGNRNASITQGLMDAQECSDER